MKTTTPIGSGKPLFELPNDRFFDAVGKRIVPIHPSTNTAPPVDLHDLEGRN